MNYNKIVLDNIVCNKCLEKLDKQLFNNEHTLAASKNRTSMTCLCKNCKNCYEISFIVPECKITNIKEVNLEKLVLEANELLNYHISNTTDIKEIEMLNSMKYSYKELIYERS